MKDGSSTENSSTSTDKTSIFGSNNSRSNNGKTVNSPLANKKLDQKKTTTCSCNEIKTLLKIKVAGNVEDLTISCNGLKTAENIADLVDGYCRIVNNTETSLWEWSRVTPVNSATNSLEKRKQHHSMLPLSTDSMKNDSCELGTATGSSHDGHLSEMSMPILSEDYVEIGLGEEEGDYSTPTVRNYELDRSQIALNEIIGVGQFGDVHIGTCRVNKPAKSSSGMDADDLISKDGESSTNGAADNNNEKAGPRTGAIHVAVKTCKADADMITSEKFLEEACKYTFYKK